MKKVCVFFAEGFEEVEALTVVDLLRRAEIETTMVSISDELQVVGAHKIDIKADKTFDELDYSKTDMVILPGGMPGTKNLSEHKGLVKLLKEFNDENKWIGAICAAPSVLGMNGILKGKTATCYPGFEDKLEGATFVTDEVSVCDHVITSRGLGTAIEFSLAIIAHLETKEKANKIKESIIYKQI